MKPIAQALSALALAVTLAAPILFFADLVQLGMAQWCMLAAAVLWFASAPVWMERRSR